MIAFVQRLVSRLFRFIRSLYDWVLSWAHSPYGSLALFLLAVAESSFFPVPPDILLIALCIALPKKALRFALICTLGSLIGGIIGYGIGHFSYDTIGRPIIDYYNGQEVMEKIRLWYDAYGFYGVFIAALTPIPYKVFTISSGFFNFSFQLFMFASVIGRSLRFFMLAVLIYWFGKPIKAFIDRYFNLLSILFVLLLVAGFLVIKLL